jgi:hypothetical protein
MCTIWRYGATEYGTGAKSSTFMNGFSVVTRLTVLPRHSLQQTNTPTVSVHGNVTGAEFLLNIPSSYPWALSAGLIQTQGTCIVLKGGGGGLEFLICMRTTLGIIQPPVLWSGSLGLGSKCSSVQLIIHDKTCVRGKGLIFDPKCPLDLAFIADRCKFAVMCFMSGKQKSHATIFFPAASNIFSIIPAAGFSLHIKMCISSHPPSIKRQTTVRYVGHFIILGLHAWYLLHITPPGTINLDLALRILEHGCNRVLYLDA